MYCGKCGKEIKDDALFCKFCGNKIGSDEKNVDQVKSSQETSTASNVDFMEKLKRSFSEIGANIKKINYTAPELLVVILLLINIIVYLITVFSYAGFLMLFLASLFIEYLCLRKERYDSVIMPICVTFIVFYDVFFSRVTLEAFQYRFPKFLIDCALVILYFLFATGVIKVKRTKQIVRDIIAGLFLIICLYRIIIMIVCAIHQMEAMAIMESLGYMLFATEFLIMILSSEGDIVSSIKVDAKR